MVLDCRCVEPAEHEVNPASLQLGEQDVGSVLPHNDCEQRMLLFQPGHGNGEKIIGLRRIEADDHTAPMGVGQFRNVPTGLGDLGQNRPSISGERFPDVGRSDATRPSFVERRSQDVFEFLQRAGRHRLGDVQSRGSADDASATRQCVHQRKMAQLQPAVEKPQAVHWSIRCVVSGWPAWVPASPEAATTWDMPDCRTEANAGKPRPWLTGTLQAMLISRMGPLLEDAPQHACHRTMQVDFCSRPPEPRAYAT